MLEYGFYNPLNGDRKYTADDLNDILNGVLNDGIIPNIGDEFAVSIASDQIMIGTGKAIISQTWTRNQTALAFDITAVEDSLRYDGIFIKVDKINRENTIHIIEGELSDDPLKPEPESDDSIAYFPLAYILVSESGAEVEDARVFSTLAIGSDVSGDTASNVIYQTGVVTADGAIKAGDPVSFFDGKVRKQVDSSVSEMTLGSINGKVSNTIVCQIDQERTIVISLLTSGMQSAETFLNVSMIYDINGTITQTTSLESFIFSSDGAASTHELYNLGILVKYISDNKVYGVSVGYDWKNSKCISAPFEINLSTLDITIGAVIVVASTTRYTDYGSVQCGVLNDTGDYWILYQNNDQYSYMSFWDKDDVIKVNMKFEARYSIAKTLKENLIVCCSTDYTGSASELKNGYIYTFTLNVKEDGTYRGNKYGGKITNMYPFATSTFIMPRIMFPVGNVMGFITQTDTTYFIFPEQNKIVNDSLAVGISGYSRDTLPICTTVASNETSLNQTVSFINSSDDCVTPPLMLSKQTDDLYSFSYLKYLDGSIKITGASKTIFDPTKYRDRNQYISLIYGHGYFVAFGYNGEKYDTFFVSKFNLDNAIALEDGEPGDTIKVAQKGIVQLPDETQECNTIGVSLRHIKDNTYEVIW